MICFISAEWCEQNVKDKHSKYSCAYESIFLGCV